jgi:GAF domain-containing protein
MRRSIRTRLTAVLIGLSIGPLLVVGILLAWLNFGGQQAQALNLQSELSRRVSAQVSSYFTELEDQLYIVSKVERLQSLDRTQQENTLAILLDHENNYVELVLLDGQGQEQARVSQRSLTLTTLVDRSTSDEFVVPKTTGQTYFGSVRFDDTTGEPLMYVAVPLLDVRSGQAQGVLVADVPIKTIWDLLAEIRVSPGQSVYIVDADGRVVAHPDDSVVLRGSTFEVPAQDGVHAGLDGQRAVLAVTRLQFGGQALSVVVEQEWSQALALAINTIYIFSTIVAVMLIIASVAGFVLVAQIVRPLQGLASAAQAISAGDLSARVKVTGGDEAGQTGQAFNLMAQEMQASRASLEQRVADRTRALALSAELSRRLSTILDRDQLVREVVEQLRLTFNYYHVHMYMWDAGQKNLVMVGGTGDAGRILLERHHQIHAGRGLVGRAADTNLPVLVPDVSKDTKWLPNPLLPDTKAEVAVPIASGTTVLGVLDVQHNVVSGLRQEDADLIQSIANQVAIALRNVQAYEDAQQQAGRGALINTINQRIQSTTDVESALQIAAREVGRALGTRRVSVRLKTPGNGRDNDRSRSTSSESAR